MNKEACEKVYGKLVEEDENFYYFQGKGEFGITIPKHAHFVLQPERSKREDSGEVVIRNRLCQNCMFPGIDNQTCKACGQIINRPEMRYSEHDGNAVREVQ